MTNHMIDQQVRFTLSTIDGATEHTGTVIRVDGDAVTISYGAADVVVVPASEVSTI